SSVRGGGGWLVRSASHSDVMACLYPAGHRRKRRVPGAAGCLREGPRGAHYGGHPMRSPLRFSLGCTNLVAAQVGNQPELRRTALQRPDGTVLTGFVERVGDPVPLVAADGSAHTADRLLVEALELMVATVGGGPAPATTIAVPAHWPSSTQWALRNALRGNATLSPGGVPPRLVSD